MSNNNRKRASSVDNKYKALKVETVVTHDKPDLRNLNKYITLFRDGYDKGYANAKYLTTGEIAKGWKRYDGKLVKSNKQVPENKVDHSLQNHIQQQTPSIVINTSSTTPTTDTPRVQTTIVKTNELIHDYQDPNKPQLNTARTKQMSIDQYVEITGKAQSDNHFQQAIDKRKYDKQAQLLAIMRQRSSPVPIPASNKPKKGKRK